LPTRGDPPRSVNTICLLESSVLFSSCGEHCKCVRAALSLTEIKLFASSSPRGRVARFTPERITQGATTLFYFADQEWTERNASSRMRDGRAKVAIDETISQFLKAPCLRALARAPSSRESSRSGFQISGGRSSDRGWTSEFALARAGRRRFSVQLPPNYRRQLITRVNFGRFSGGGACARVNSPPRVPRILSPSRRSSPSPPPHSPVPSRRRSLN